MKQFFKYMFASMLGFILGSVLLFFIMLAVVSGLMLAFKGDDTVSVKDKTVLQLTFEGPIEERTGKNPFQNLNFSNLKSGGTPGLDEILKSIRKAQNDERIEGIFMNLTSVNAGIATIEEIRNALAEFKKSKKFIYAYSESYSQGAYYMASLADSIYLYPEGDFDFKGLRATLMFFKGTLEKLEIKPEIIRHGKFKSAIEPFMYDKMSAENRQQIDALLKGIWNNIISGIATSRNISRNELQRIADGLEARNPEDAVRLKLVDRLVYYDEVLSLIKKKTGIEEKEKARLVSLKNYTKVFVKGDDFTAKKIAIIYACGDIVSGEGENDETGSERIAAAIRKARLDTTIKAIVFRINSPGGSALASDVIWRETVLAQRAKPFIASMGDYAASGGYYIACAADTIVARPNTLTGSIGVFGLLFNTQDMFKNKLGVTFDTVKTARYADIGELNRPLNPDERKIIQEMVDKIYDTFITHVANGRGMEKSAVDSIGQGRVWTGAEAKSLGLVDVLGGLNDAIEIAAKKANLSKYRTVAMPEQKELLEQLMEDLNAEAKTYFAKDQLGEAFPYYKKLNELMKAKGIQAKMINDVIIDF